jgi:radical SAM protein with 4Fe4S-binding SPASM domain
MKTDYVIHPNGDVLPCIYGFKNVLGNIYEMKLSDIILKEQNSEICSLLREEGIYNLLQKANMADDIGSSDICDLCNSYVFLYRNGR